MKDIKTCKKKWQVLPSTTIMLQQVPTHAIRIWEVSTSTKPMYKKDKMKTLMLV
jgi:hypothetical protein